MIGRLINAWEIVNIVPEHIVETKYICECLCGRIFHLSEQELLENKECKICQWNTDAQDKANEINSYQQRKQNIKKHVIENADEFEKSINRKYEKNKKLKSIPWLSTSTHNFTNGWSKKGTGISWYSMIQRCYNPNSKAYKYYGGRGIIVCDAWKNDFMQFYKDMGDRPNGYSIDRIDVDGNYEPSNCRWATDKVQANNKRTNIVYGRVKLIKILHKIRDSI